MKLSTQFDTEFVVKYIIAEILGMIMEYCKKYRRLQWEVIEKAKRKAYRCSFTYMYCSVFFVPTKPRGKLNYKENMFGSLQARFWHAIYRKTMNTMDYVSGTHTGRVCVHVIFLFFSIQKRHKCFVVKLMRFLLNTNCISSYQNHVSFNLVILKSTSE